MSEPFKGLAPANIRVIELDYIPPYVLICPYFIVQPSSDSVDAGEDAVFTVEAEVSNDADISYQWEVSTDGGASWDAVIDGSAYSGATTAELTAIAVTGDQQSYLYRAQAESNGCTVASSEAMLTVVIVTAVDRMQVGAGGGGGGFYGGGGAGGQVIEDSIELNPTLSYAVVIGDGGIGGSNPVFRGTNGGDTTFNGDTAKGGGGGGGGGFPSVYGVGASGGPGGGSSVNSGAGVFTPGGVGTPGGNGGAGYWSGGDEVAGGGGGSTDATGQSAYNLGQNGGDGAAGRLSSISGTPVYYGSGGGGGVQPLQTPGAGGTGGGGAGGKTTNGFPGSAPGGGGGGGSGNLAARNGGDGYHGELVLRYFGAPRWVGGVVTTDAGDTVHTFTASGSLDPL